MISAPLFLTLLGIWTWTCSAADSSDWMKLPGEDLMSPLSLSSAGKLVMGNFPIYTASIAGSVCESLADELETRQWHRIIRCSEEYIIIALDAVPLQTGNLTLSAEMIEGRQDWQYPAPRCCYNHDCLAKDR